MHLAVTALDFQRSLVWISELCDFFQCRPCVSCPGEHSAWPEIQSTLVPYLPYFQLCFLPSLLCQTPGLAENLSCVLSDRGLQCSVHAPSSQMHSSLVPPCRAQSGALPLPRLSPGYIASPPLGAWHGSRCSGYPPGSSPSTSQHGEFCQIRLLSWTV